MKKLKPVNVLLGLIALAGAGHFAYVAISTGNLYKFGWMIPLVAVSLCFITAPHYSATCSGIFSILMIPASVIGIIAGIFITGKAGSITMVLSFSGLGSGIGGLFLSVFLGWIAGTIVPTYDGDYSEKSAAALNTEKNDKDASVIGRAVVGGVIAGGAGAVVGALSAIDKNNRKNNKQQK